MPGQISGMAGDGPARVNKWLLAKVALALAPLPINLLYLSRFRHPQLGDEFVPEIGVLVVTTALGLIGFWYLLPKRWAQNIREVCGVLYASLIATLIYQLWQLFPRR